MTESLDRISSARRLAVCQVDGKWPNLALAKIAGYRAVRGLATRWFNALETYDLVCAGKVFAETPDDPYLPPDTLRGGSGYDLSSALPEEIERSRPDWSLWPRWLYDMAYSSRGCVRHCPFCVVPAKEGALRVVASFADLTTGRSTMILNDNNITAAPLSHFRQLCADATAAGVTIDFRQGLDARLLTPDHCGILARSRVARRIHLAFDNVADEAAVRRSVAYMAAAGIPPQRLTFYVLVGFDTLFDEDMWRVELLRSLGCNPFVMRYEGSDRLRGRLARWVNQPAVFRSMTWPQWLATFKSREATQ